MKRHYTLFSLVALVAFLGGNMRAMSQFYRLGKQAHPYARQVGQRMFSSGSLNQGFKRKAPALSQQLASQQALQRRSFFNPTVFTRYRSSWQAAKDAFAEQGQPVTDMIKRYQKLFTGGTIGAGAWLAKHGGALLSEDNKNDYQKYLKTEYERLASGAILLPQYKRPVLIAYWILIPGKRGENVHKEPKHTYVDLFKQHLEKGYKPNYLLLEKVFEARGLKAPIERLLSLINAEIVRPGDLFGDYGPHYMTASHRYENNPSNIEPELKELLIAAQTKDPNVFSRKGVATSTSLIDKTKGRIRELYNEIEDAKKLEQYERFEAGKMEQRSKIKEYQDRIRYQKALLSIIDPPVPSNFFGWWR